MNYEFFFLKSKLQMMSIIKCENEIDTLRVPTVTVGFGFASGSRIPRRQATVNIV